MRLVNPKFRFFKILKDKKMEKESLRPSGSAIALW
jgi:hypothetical protein